jgi:hypothetical protein
VPDKFKSVHITQLAGGEASAEFTGRLQSLFAQRGRDEA